MAIGYNEIRKNEEIKAYLKKGDANLAVLGYTDHSSAHTTLVAARAAYILDVLGYSDKEMELAKIAGYMHDIGNSVNRSRHAEYGALLADTILRGTDLPVEDRVTVISAIGNHDESTGGPTDAVSAAVIIADKTDVRRSRVRTRADITTDIHDRVNYAVTDNELSVDADSRLVTLRLEIDETICTMYEYFDIFLQRMLLSRRSAEMLEAKFSLVVNGVKIL